jgi:hypothetical protein
MQAQHRDTVLGTRGVGGQADGDLVDLASAEGDIAGVFAEKNLGWMLAWYDLEKTLSR